MIVFGINTKEIDCEQSLIFLCKVTTSLYNKIITSWFAIALDQIKT